MFAAARHVTGGYPALYSNDGLHQLLERHLSNLTFERLSLPSACDRDEPDQRQACHLYQRPTRSRTARLRRNTGIFPPVRVEGDMYVDGGAVDNTNLDIAIQMGARRLFILDVGYDATGEGESSGTASSPATSDAASFCRRICHTPSRRSSNARPRLSAGITCNTAWSAFHPALRCMCCAHPRLVAAARSTSRARPSGWSRGIFATNEYLQAHSRRHAPLQARAAE